MLQDCFRGKGYRVQAVVDGPRALEAARADTFQGIILDIGLPLMDGMEVLRQIRRWDQQTPIVMVTASGSKDLAVRAIGMGAQAYLLKPFDVDELQRIAEHWFRPLARPPVESPASKLGQGE